MYTVAACCVRCDPVAEDGREEKAQARNLGIIVSYLETGAEYDVKDIDKVNDS